MEHTCKHLYDVVDPRGADDVLGETLHIAKALSLDGVDSTIRGVHADIIRLFNGEFPGYRRSTAKYHNLEHTCSVVLATARLLHGCVLDRVLDLSGREFMLCIMSSYFHDTGLIQEVGDTEGTGAKYTIGHEQRSIDFMRRYMSAGGFAVADMRACEEMIKCTILNMSPDDISFSSPKIGLLGRIVGTADLIAQLADRTYLEKLGLLFLEFQEAKLPGFSSELDLIMKTEAFYTNVAKRRMIGGLQSLYLHMVSHFRQRWGVCEDLYSNAIDRNIAYIKVLAEKCKEEADCYDESLRREHEGQ